MKFIVLIIISFLTFKSLAQNGTKNFIDQNYIEVTGKAEIEIIPDEIYLKILIHEDDLPQNKSIEEVENEMITKLSKEGIDVTKELKIKDMASNLNRHWLKNDKAIATKEYELLLCDSETTVEVFRKLKPLGITNISIEKVSHSKLKQFREEVQINAIKIAKHKAEMLTKAIDQVCGKAIYINELNYSQQNHNSNTTNISMEYNYSISRLKSERYPILQFEKIRLISTMQVKFKIS